MVYKLPCLSKKFRDMVKFNPKFLEYLNANVPIMPQQKLMLIDFRDDELHTLTKEVLKSGLLNLVPESSSPFLDNNSQVGRTVNLWDRG